MQLAEEIKGDKLTEEQIKFAQEVIGVFMFYSRAVDPTMFTQVNKMATKLAEPTTDLLDQIRHFLGYAATYPNATKVIKPSGMRYVVHSDASYLSETRARSRAGGVGFLTDWSDDLTGPISNAPVEVLSSVIPTVVAAASEAEYAATFMNGQNSMPVKHTLADLGYPQGAVTIVTDNSTASGVANGTTKIKRSKAIDMRYHWTRDKVKQGEIEIIWRPGIDNQADIFTKTLPVNEFNRRRQNYVLMAMEEIQDQRFTSTLFYQ
jgi:hypothetical protein